MLHAHTSVGSPPTRIQMAVPRLKTRGTTGRGREHRHSATLGAPRATRELHGQGPDLPRTRLRRARGACVSGTGGKTAARRGLGSGISLCFGHRRPATGGSFSPTAVGWSGPVPAHARWPRADACGRPVARAWGRSRCLSTRAASDCDGERRCGGLAHGNPVWNETRLSIFFFVEP